MQHRKRFSSSIADPLSGSLLTRSTDRLHQSISLGFQSVMYFWEPDRCQLINYFAFRYASNYHVERMNFYNILCVCVRQYKNSLVSLRGARGQIWSHPNRFHAQFERFSRFAERKRKLGHEYLCSAIYIGQLSTITYFSDCKSALTRNLQEFPDVMRYVR